VLEASHLQTADPTLVIALDVMVETVWIGKA
jgi:hypothetical protein